MDANLTTGKMMRGAPYGAVDLQGPMPPLHQQQNSYPGLQQQQQQQNQQQQQQQHHLHHHSQMGPPVQEPVPGLVRGDRGKVSTSEDDDTEDRADDHGEMEKGKKASPWHRMKWTDAMVKLLITIVSYIGEDVASECNGSGRRKVSILQKKGKWRLVSKVMAERGCYVSPQQCEDKFNDLNKRYKRLNEILGRGTSCEVVENPALLDMMPHISEKAKEDVRKILSSKHLFYEEMCSYHNGNRMHLPADPSLQQSLQNALHSKDENDNRRASQDDTNEEDHDADTDDNEDEIDNNHELNEGVQGSCYPKRTKIGMDLSKAAGNSCSSQAQDYCRGQHPQGFSVDINPAFSEGPKNECLQRQWVASRMLQLEEQRLQIQAEMLELEKQRFKWKQFSKKKDRELEKMRMENEQMKLENEHLVLELKQKELNASVHRLGS